MNDDLVEDIQTLPDDLFDTFDSATKCGEIFVNKGEFQYLCTFCYANNNNNNNNSNNITTINNGQQSNNTNINNNNIFLNNLHEFSQHLFQSHQVFNFEPILNEATLKKNREILQQQQQQQQQQNDFVDLIYPTLNIENLINFDNQNEDYENNLININSNSNNSNNNSNISSPPPPRKDILTNYINNNDNEFNLETRKTDTENNINESENNEILHKSLIIKNDIILNNNTNKKNINEKQSSRPYQEKCSEFQINSIANNDLSDIIQCKFCPKIFTTVEKYENHQNQKHQRDLDPGIPKGYFRCKICQKILSLTCGRKKHEDSHFIGKRICKCHICDKQLASPNSLKVHLRVHNQNNDYYKCAYCPASFKFSASLNQHQSSHLGLRKFECRYCGKKFLQNSHRKNHELLHSNQKPFVCFCGKSFQRKDYLDSHSKKHLDKKTRPFSCCEENCNSTFTSEKYLKIHQGLHKKGTIYQCKYCEKQSIVKNIIERHEKTHLKSKEQFDCNLCPKQFESKNGLINHLRTKHPGNALLEFKCGQCESIFRNSAELQNHIREVCSLAVKQYACDLCSGRFDTKHGLKVHRAVQHQTEIHNLNQVTNNLINFNNGNNNNSDILLNNNDKISELIQEIFS